MDIEPHGVHRTHIVEIRNALLRGDELGPLDREDVTKILTHEIERLYHVAHPRLAQLRRDNLRRKGIKV